MGSSASVSPDKKEFNTSGNLRQNPYEAESMRAVLKFTELALDSSPKSEVIKIILTNSAARTAFVSFLKAQRENNLLLIDSKKACEPISEQRSQAEIIFHEYALPAHEVDVSDSFVSSIAENISKLLSGERDFSNDQIALMLETAKGDSVLLKALDALPSFLTSDFFKNWRAKETERAVNVTLTASPINVTLPEILAADPSMLEGSTIVSTEAVFSTQDIIAEYAQAAERKRSDVDFFDGVVAMQVGSTSNTTSSDEEDVVEAALRNVDYLEIDRLLRSGSWLFTFVAAVERIPICVTLSTARKDRVGFPLIYVNKYFEETSGYLRSDIMGANCKFLQRDATGIARSEGDSVERLSNALRSAEPIKVAITNFRRDGSPFKNLLAIKPVFDLKGDYQYVIGVQFDISSARASSYSLRLVESLVNMLPSVVSF